MINFRFHLISLIAVFLALAIGVVMGSAVIDRVIVDGLRTRIDQVERNADSRRDENDRLKAEAGRTTAYIDATAPYAVTNRLTGVPVVVIAWRGSDEGVVRDQVELMAIGGAKVAGIGWLERPWARPAERVGELAAALGSSGSDVAALRRLAWERASARFAGSGSVEIFDRLSDAGFVTFEPVGEAPVAAEAGQFAPAGASVEVVIGTGSPPVALETLPALVGALVEARVPTVVGEIFKDTGKKGAARGALLAPVRDEAALSAKVSTIDNVDVEQGRVAAGLALAAAPSGRIGKFGVGPGTKPVPEWTQP